MAEEIPATPQSSPLKLILFKFAPYVLGILAIAGVTAYGVKQYPQVLGLSKGSAQVQAEVDALAAEVGKLIDLPQDEKPTVATVTDIEKVKEQPFFKNAKNGDKVLIYTNAKKAILYRPEEKRIIEVGAVNINQAAPTPEAEEEAAAAEKTPSPTETPKEEVVGE